MIKKLIYKANRGEGKTRWLVDRTLENVETASSIFYIGSYDSYRRFVDVYECIAQEVCKVKYINSTTPLKLQDCSRVVFLSDDLLDDLSSVLSIRIPQYDNITWYITLSGEDFVN